MEMEMECVVAAEMEMGLDVTSGGCSLSVATFRSDYEYAIEYENNFSIPGRGYKIVIFPTNIVPIVSFSTGQ